MNPGIQRYSLKTEGLSGLNSVLVHPVVIFLAAHVTGFEINA